MKNTIKGALFFAAMLSFAVACQSKKSETEETAATTDTATVVESETIVSGDSAEIITDSAKIAIPDSVK
ncbi:hypothetical protein WBJ53_20675 [Spirosoma sp. SC4-14]|uniref:hypothetical protein n=1 Tax=Spirosoma sp. SC4-14 TaxID=3128900 RepID=UPI0030D08042